MIFNIIQFSTIIYTTYVTLILSKQNTSMALKQYLQEEQRWAQYQRGSQNLRY